MSRPELLKKWVINMKRDAWVPNKKSVLCSDHFQESCFDMTGQTVRIRIDAEPTIFLFPSYLLRAQFHGCSFIKKQQDRRRRKLVKWDAIPTLDSSSTDVSDDDVAGKPTKQRKRQLASKVQRQRLLKRLIVPQQEIPSTSPSQSTCSYDLSCSSSSSSSSISGKLIGDIAKLERRVDKMEDEQARESETEQASVSWSSLRPEKEEGPKAPPESVVHRLARALQQVRFTLSAGRDTNEVDSVLTLLSYWPHLSTEVRKYAFARLQLLYVALTKGWNHALQMHAVRGNDLLVLPENFSLPVIPQISAAEVPVAEKCNGISSSELDRNHGK